MLERLRTILVVTLVTLLIWLYAESQNLDVLRKSGIEVQIIPPATSNLVIRRASPDQTFRLELEGSTGAIAEVTSELSRPLRLPLGTDVMPDRPGKHNVAMTDVLRAIPSIGGLGLTIRGVDPPTLEYTVDRFQDVLLDVRVAELPGVQIEGAIAVNPARVRVRIPMTALGERDPQSLRLVATPDAAALAAVSEGTPANVPALLSLPELPDSSGVAFDVSTVRLAFTLKSQRAALTLPAVPIHLVLPEVDQARYDISLASPFIAGVRINGPSQLLQRIQSGSFPLFAYLILGSDELAQGVTRKQLSFAHWPADLTVESGPHEVEITITRRPQ